MMTCARAILAATDEGSDPAALIREVGCGIVVDPGSSERLAEAILAAADDPSNLFRMGEAGRLCVLSQYSPPAIARMYHDLIMSILN